MTYTKKQWYAHPSFRAELADLLNHPTLRVALEIVKDRGLIGTPLIGDVDLIHYFALMGARKDGYLEALINLEDLSKPEAAPPPERKPWTSPEPPATPPV